MAPSTFTITYSKEGTIRPVFVAGSFSSTPWQPQEMDQDSREDPASFSKTFSAGPGIYQYKFRLGTGDWWVVDDSQETATDDHGNVNNVLIVQEDQQKPSSSEPSFAQRESFAKPLEMVADSPDNLPEGGKPELLAAALIPEISVMAYERPAIFTSQKSSAAAAKVIPETDMSHDLPTPPISEGDDDDVVETEEMPAEPRKDEPRESEDLLQTSETSPANKSSSVSAPRWDRNGMILLAVAVAAVPVVAWSLSR